MAHNRSASDEMPAPAGQSRIRVKEAVAGKVGGLNLFSNVFMSVALRDREACEYVIRILTGIHDRKVTEVRTQYWIPKVTSKDSGLDVFAEDSSGRLYNLEIQRLDTVDHARRTRLYASMIDSEYLMKGKDYTELPEVYVIYISEVDLWKTGLTVCPVEKRLGEEFPYDDGQHIVYINAEIDDGSEIADLMRYFETADPDDMRFGALSRRVRQLKVDERSGPEMRDAEREIIEIGRELGREEGRSGMARDAALNMHRKGYSVREIADVLGISSDTLTAWLEEASVITV